MQAEAPRCSCSIRRRSVLECRICVGPVDITGARLAIGQGVVGLAVAENATQIVADAATDPRVWRAGDEASGFVTRSLLCAPLAHGGGSDRRARDRQPPRRRARSAPTTPKCCA